MSDPPPTDEELLDKMQRFLDRLDRKYGYTTYDEDRAAILHLLATNNTDTQENRS